MATIAPTLWTDNVVVVASAALALGGQARGTLDLRAKFGAYLFVRIGRGGVNALTDGIDVLVRRTLNNGAIIHPGPHVALLSSAAAASATTVNVDSAAGQRALNVALITGFAAGDVMVIGPGTAREEYARVSKTAAGVLTVDDNLQFTHTAVQADPVRNKADVFSPVWLPGGALYEVVFDYGNDASGDSAQVEAKAQTYDSDTLV